MKNNNRMISYKLAKQSLKAYRIRNIFTLITIILSVSLLAGLGFSADAVNTEYKRELVKGNHVIFGDVSVEQMQQLKMDKTISSSSALKRGKSFEVNDFILIPYYIEDSRNPMFGLEIVEGEYPTKYNQVLVDKQLMDYLGKEAKLGEKFEIAFLDGSIETFEVSGFLESETKSNVFALLLSKDYAEKGSQLKNVPYEMAAQIEGARDLSKDEFIDKLIGIGAQYGIKQKNVKPNNRFADSLNFEFNKLRTYILLGIAILFLSVIVIYSIFYISIAERTRQFGQLRTIGMTKVQIKKMVRYEGAILSVIGSIIGIFIGSLFAYILKPQGFNIIHLITISIGILIADFITVQISIAKPSKIASNIAPIEAMKRSGYETKKLYSKKLYRKLSPFSLSLIAATGNRKKTFFTAISLCLAGVAYMAASTFIHSMSEERFARQGWLEYGEFVFSLSSNAAEVNEHGYIGLQQNNPMNETLIKEIKEIKGVKDVMVKGNLHLTYSYHEENSEDMICGITREDVEVLRSYSSNPNMDYDTMVKNKEVYVLLNKLAKEIYGWKFKVGDSVQFRWFNGEEYVEDTFIIAGEFSDKAYNNLDTYHRINNTGWFIGADKMIEDMMLLGFNLNNIVVISSEDYEKYGSTIEEQLNAIKEEHPSLSLGTLSNAMESSKNVYTSITIGFMAMASFVIAFSLINLMNTLISNIVARKREYACFRTLGMTQRQVVKMIQGEGLYLTIINILCTSTVGSLVGYLIVLLLNNQGIRYLEYQFPWIYLLGYVALALTFTIVISQITMKNMSNKTLVETMRETE